MTETLKTMMPKISIITLGVNDLTPATAFYRDGLGLPYSEHSNPHISFFELCSTWLALYPKDALAKDIGIDASGQGFGGITLAHNVDNKSDVDGVLDLVAGSGGEIIKPAKEAFWGGYSGYFADLDGYIWEVAWNPHFQLN